jgi:hypothetical protein
MMEMKFEGCLVYPKEILISRSRCPLKTPMFDSKLMDLLEVAEVPESFFLLSCLASSFFEPNAKLALDPFPHVEELLLLENEEAVEEFHGE